MKIICNATGCAVDVKDDQATLLLKRGFSTPKPKAEASTTPESKQATVGQPKRTKRTTRK